MLIYLIVLIADIFSHQVMRTTTKRRNSRDLVTAYNEIS
jgi:hypothetical protein